LEGNIKAVREELQATDSFIQKYLPFKMLNYIHDSMIRILDRKELQKLFDYLQKSYQLLLEDIKNPEKQLRPFNKTEYSVPHLTLSDLPRSRRKHGQIGSMSYASFRSGGFSDFSKSVRVKKDSEDQSSEHLSVRVDGSGVKRKKGSRHGKQPKLEIMRFVEDKRSPIIRIQDEGEVIEE